MDNIPIKQTLYRTEDSSLHSLGIVTCYDLDRSKVILLNRPISSKEIIFFVTFQSIGYEFLVLQTPDPTKECYIVKGTIPKNQQLATAYGDKIRELKRKLFSSPVKEKLSLNVSSVIKANEKKVVISNDILENFDIKNLSVGGLDKQMKSIFQHMFSTRILKEDAQKMGVKPVRGILLYGPPGCGKTLIARELAKIIKAKTFRYVAGPELKSGVVGSSEKNIRELFKNAESDFQNKIPGIHVIVFDEFDSLAESRDSKTNKTNNVDVDIVNQLLTKIDGLDSLDNILMIAMTNRKNSLDPALLRPGRFEIHIEVTLPDFDGRKDIFKIYLKKLIDNGYLNENVDVDKMAALTSNFSGAEIKSVVDKTVSRKLSEKIDMDTLNVVDDTKILFILEDFIETISETVPQMAESLVEMNKISLSLMDKDSVDISNDIIQKMIEIINLPNIETNNKSFLIIGKTNITNRISAYVTKEILKYLKHVTFLTPEYYMNSTKSIWKIFDEERNFDKAMLVINSFETIIDSDPRSIDAKNLKILLNSNISEDKIFITLVTCSENELIDEMRIKQKFTYVYNI